LNHKTLDGTMKNSIVIKTFFGQKDKIIDSNGSLVGMKLDSNISLGSA